jgi:competence protein ComEA
LPDAVGVYGGPARVVVGETAARAGGTQGRSERAVREADSDRSGGQRAPIEQRRRPRAAAFRRIPMTLRRIVATGLALALALVASTGLAVAAEKAAPAGKVNINTASVDQLATLPGVGEKLAGRIVEYRTKSGGFKNVQELMNVKGIGEKNFEKLQPHLTAEGKPAAAGR